VGVIAHNFGTRTRRLAVCLTAVTTLAIGTTVAVSTPAGARLDPSVPQEPFLCTTEYNGLGQPTVDNQDKEGTPVYPESAPDTPDRNQDPLGWSKRCQAATRVEYRYRTTGGEMKALPAGLTELPADVAMIDASTMVGTDHMQLGGLTQIPYVYRYERGTLPQNRFIYSIAMLVPFQEYLDGVGTDGPWDDSYWNGRLLFSFGGGDAPAEEATEEATDEPSEPVNVDDLFSFGGGDAPAEEEVTEVTEENPDDAPPVQPPKKRGRKPKKTE